MPGTSNISSTRSNLILIAKGNSSARLAWPASATCYLKRAVFWSQVPLLKQVLW
jgi:hypothetical protein